MFKSLDPKDPLLRALVKGLHWSDTLSGEVVMEQGSGGDALFVLVEGQAEISVNGKTVAKIMADLDANLVHNFGEISILARIPRTATVTITSQTATTILVTVEEIEQHFGSVAQLLDMQGTCASDLVRTYKNG